MRNIYKDEQIVSKYNLARDIPDHILNEYAENIVDAVGGGTIVDAGFGTGMVLLPLARLTRTIGIDSSIEMLNSVESKLNNSLDAKLIEGDINQIKNLVNESYNTIHLKAVTHIPDMPGLMLFNLCQALPRGGYIVIGKEYSQPEDNLEDIQKFNGNIDTRLSNFYGHYFELRKQIDKPYVRAAMPAGDYDDAVAVMTSIMKMKEQGEFCTQKWNRVLTFLELIESMQKGTFTVFSNGLSTASRNYLAEQMESYCEKQGLVIDKPFLYEACLKAKVLQKS